jgi:galactose-1-phosphate uridylyltransferase
MNTQPIIDSSSTAEDMFGRLEHRLSYTAANTFKYDRWHTLIVSRNHDTLHLTEDELSDMFELAKEWFNKAYSLESSYSCPELIWDAMPKSGASQVHTHLQVSLGNDIYYGNIERTRQGARLYANQNDGRNYFKDYLYVHQCLGLTIPVGTARILVHLVGFRSLNFHRRISFVCHR